MFVLKHQQYTLLYALGSASISCDSIRICLVRCGLEFHIKLCYPCIRLNSGNWLLVHYFTASHDGLFILQISQMFFVNESNIWYKYELILSFPFLQSQKSPRRKRNCSVPLIIRNKS